MSMQEPPQGGQQRVQLQETGPLPFSTTVTHVSKPIMVDEEGHIRLMPFVRVIHSTPAGISDIFWAPDDATKIAHDILKHAREAKTGLTIVGDGIGRGGIEEVVKESVREIKGPVVLEPPEPGDPGRIETEDV